MSDLDAHTAAVLRLIAESRRPGARLLLGIAGPPGSGKSTLAARVVERLNHGGRAEAALLPMDGFHLENDVLESCGLLAVKGAPQTFDAAGFVRLVRSLRNPDEDVAYPLFDRARDCTLPGAGRLPAGTPVVVVEGNYLLLRSGDWAGLQGLFDAAVMIAPPVEVLEARLIYRWLEHGLSAEAAARRARGNDLANARLVMAQSATADLVLGDAEATVTP